MNALWHKLIDGRQRLVTAVALLVLCIGLTYLAEYSAIRLNLDRFLDAADRRSLESLAIAQREFSAIQATALRAAQEAARAEELHTYLSGADTSRAPVFDLLVDLAHRREVGIELYNSAGALVAWEGRSGPAHTREIAEALRGTVSSFVSRTLVASQLFVVVPVRDSGTIRGAVLVRRTVDVNYPLSNRFIQREGLTRELSRRLGAEVEFNFAGGAPLRKDGRYSSVYLYGMDSTRVGTVSIRRPPRSLFLQGIAAPYQVIESLLIVVLGGVLVVALWRILHRTVVRRSLRIAGGLLLIWGMRYLLLAVDVSTLLPANALTDPSTFASQFGFGLARSLVELTLTMIALLASVVYCLSVARQEYPAVTIPSWLQPRWLVLRILLSSAIILLLYWLLRGFAATVCSAVNDSTLRYADQQELFPSLALSLMTLDMLAAASCMVIAGIAAAHVVVRCLAGGTPGTWSWISATLLVVVLAWLFGPIQETPLMPFALRAGFGVVVLLAVSLMSRDGGVFRWTFDPPAVVFVLVAALALYYPLLDRFVQAKDRDRVEMFADQVSRPADNWLTFIVEEGLQGFSSDETVETLLDDDPDDVGRIAFSRWAQSLACREGYASMFSVYDTTGTLQSRFFIGAQIQQAMEADTTVPAASDASIRVYHVGSGDQTIDVYAGSNPILTYDGKIIGYGKVIVAASRQTLFRGETPRLLRSSEADDLDSFYRQITVSEYRDAALVATTNSSMPLHYRMPGAALRALAMPDTRSAWIDEMINSRRYESYYVRRPDDGGVVALSMVKAGTRWYVVGLVKLLSFAAALAMAWVAGLLLFRRLRGEPVLPTFRERLLAALLITALVPLVLNALYGRFMARENVLSNLSNRLGEYTAALVQNIPMQVDSLLKVGSTVPHAAAEELAGDIGTDYNVYVGGSIVLTSRPELYEAGILDTRISGRAFDDVMVRERRFIMETENIGAYAYAVGYRPVIGNDGNVAYVVSVPTLFRQDELDAEISGRNVFVLGIYLVVFVAVLFIAGVFANRIAAPVHNLTEATRRVAGGDFDVELGEAPADGEIGELVKSFSSMTQHLKRSRQELVHAEREMAWREMARQVAHEIKNPLTPMRLAIQHLRMVFREGGTDVRQVLEEVTQTLLNQIDTLSRIASEFSNYARMPRPELHPCDPLGPLHEAAQLFDREESVSQVFHGLPSVPPVLADRDELRRAFVNIIRNAVQAMEGKGSIEYTASVIGAAVEIVIHDSGPGIPKEFQEKLFQPNFSTKTEGMGLGLAIVKKTIDDLGGMIRIESPEGEGTSVIIRLPLHDGVGRREEGKDSA